MKYIICSRENNSISILTLAGTNTVESVVNSPIIGDSTYKIVNNIDFIDFRFLIAYNFDKELGAKINISKAKEIWKDRFRQARKPILEKLDVEYMRALEAGDTQKQQEIATKKQALRDITNTSLPNDLEDIKNTWPDVLNS